MSVASLRGKTLERKVASLLRKRLGARVERDRRSGAGINKADISDYFRELPLFIECKDQETLKVKEWMRQAIDGASVGQVPTLVFRMESDIMACVRFADLVNFLIEIADMRAEIHLLRKPVMTHHAGHKADRTCEVITELNNIVTKNIETGAKTCKNGHICDDFGYCQQKGCQYSRGYKVPKNKSKGGK